MRRSFCFSRSCNPYSDKRCLRSLFTPPGGTSSLHFDSRGLTPLFRNRSVPSRRDSLHLGPVYFAITNLCATFWGELAENAVQKPSNAALFRRTTSVMGDRSHIFNVGDLETAAVQRSDGGLAAGARAHYPHLHILHAMLLRGIARSLGGDLRRERRRLARAAEAAAARGRPGQGVTLPIGDRDDGVVERSMYVRDRVQHILADLLADGLAGLRAAAGALARLFLISHGVSLLNLTWGGVHLHGLLARSLAGTGIGARALAAHRQPLAMPDASIAAQVHQALDVHGHLAAQITLDPEFGDLGPRRGDLRVRQILHLDVVLHAGGVANAHGPAVSNADNVGQADDHMLVPRYVDAGDTRHLVLHPQIGRAS